ncbi:MAG: 23S rRNA (guanosine(2251)-2'-O)-methyltransferase RlmB [Duodenibacillus sp.]|nr:23S rRNA (guanosine(2251)-2'-O)-methyltransferase RlmB [Duodenibacillus sp.]
MKKNVVLAGFHAVNARVKLHPETVRALYADPSRRDKRMQDARARAAEAGLRVMAADPARLEALAPGLPHQGIVALADPLEPALTFDELMDAITDRTLLLVLDGVTDPRNFGACLRVADAAGVQAVIAPRDRSADFSAAAAKAAAGAWESVPVVTVTNLAGALAELKDAGVAVVGTAGEAAKTLYEVDQRRAFAWVLGAEGDGMRQLTRKRCTELVQIPMAGAVESLNVSVAAGICLFETVRQRRA